MIEKVNRLKVPIIADSVLSPCFLYGDHGGLYFVTEDDQHGRITFENLDAVKICRGEMMPYEYDYSKHESGDWVYVIENSKWQRERFEYENEHYSGAYEFGGNVNDMLTDFKHYLFVFHDQFVEVIARGFWFEKSEASLFQKGLQEGHPFLPLSQQNMEILECGAFRSQIRRNKKSKMQLIADAQFCSQQLYEFALELNGQARVDHRVLLFYRSGQLISTLLRGGFAKTVAQFEGVVSLEEVKPYIEKYMAGR